MEQTSKKKTSKPYSPEFRERAVRLSEADRQAFLERFISFRTLGISTGLSWAVLLELLEAERITPSFGSARIYDRAEIAYLLP
ncbi:hypothetical protein [Cypionkella sinensis]|uniref:Uncharacterized protein n=1 Tax=Cypionkella sinensis TaxID=1756043 RepID=A0ABV7IX77_9RHOB